MTSSKIAAADRRAHFWDPWSMRGKNHVLRMYPKSNVTDAQGFKHVCPGSGAVYADKGYGLKPAQTAAQKCGVHLAAIKKNNMKGKDPDKDRWLTAIRSPYETVFSKQNRRVRYVGIAKNQFAEFMNAICFNMRRMVVLGPPQERAVAG